MQVLLLSLLFTGYLVNIAAVTPVLQWVHYLSVFFFGFEGLIVNEMSGISLIFAVGIGPPLPMCISSEHAYFIMACLGPQDLQPASKYILVILHSGKTPPVLEAQASCIPALT